MPFLLKVSIRDVQCDSALQGSSFPVNILTSVRFGAKQHNSASIFYPEATAFDETYKFEIKDDRDVVLQPLFVYLYSESAKSKGHIGFVTLSLEQLLSISANGNIQSIDSWLSRKGYRIPNTEYSMRESEVDFSNEKLLQPTPLSMDSANDMRVKREMTGWFPIWSSSRGICGAIRLEIELRSFTNTSTIRRTQLLKQHTVNNDTEDESEHSLSSHMRGNDAYSDHESDRSAPSRGYNYPGHSNEFNTVFNQIQKRTTQESGEPGSVVFFSVDGLEPRIYPYQAYCGFVEELLVEDDPEYIRDANNMEESQITGGLDNNDARSVQLHNLSYRLRTLLTHKASALGANAVIGFVVKFDLEGDSGLVARAYGTAVDLYRPRIMDAKKAKESATSAATRALLPLQQKIQNLARSCTERQIPFQGTQTVSANWNATADRRKEDALKDDELADATVVASATSTTPSDSPVNPIALSKIPVYKSDTADDKPEMPSSHEAMSPALRDLPNSSFNDADFRVSELDTTGKRRHTSRRGKQYQLEKERRKQEAKYVRRETARAEKVARRGLELPISLESPMHKYSTSASGSLSYDKVSLITTGTLLPHTDLNIGGMVSSRSVKYLGRLHAAVFDQETRDGWWSELRTEIRKHAVKLGCNAIMGYDETTYLRGDSMILSVTGTAVYLKQGITRGQSLVYKQIHRNSSSNQRLVQLLTKHVRNSQFRKAWNGPSKTRIWYYRPMEKLLGLTEDDETITGEEDPSDILGQVSNGTSHFDAINATTKPRERSSRVESKGTNFEQALASRGLESEVRSPFLGSLRYAVNSILSPTLTPLLPSANQAFEDDIPPFSLDDAAPPRDKQSDYRTETTAQSPLVLSPGNVRENQLSPTNQNSLLDANLHPAPASQSDAPYSSEFDTAAEGGISLTEFNRLVNSNVNMVPPSYIVRVQTLGHAVKLTSPCFESNDFSNSPTTAAQRPCSFAHIRLGSPGTMTPFNGMVVHTCRICKKSYVPGILLSTMECPPLLPTSGPPVFIQSFAMRRLPKVKNAELECASLSENLLFLEIALHQQLIIKLKASGRNAIFSVQSTISFNGSIIIGTMFGTATYCLSLPPPGEFSAQDPTKQSQAFLAAIHAIQDINVRNRMILTWHQMRNQQLDAVLEPISAAAFFDARGRYVLARRVELDLAARIMLMRSDWANNNMKRRKLYLMDGPEQTRDSRRARANSRRKVMEDRGRRHDRSSRYYSDSSRTSSSEDSNRRRRRSRYDSSTESSSSSTQSSLSTTDLSDSSWSDSSTDSDRSFLRRRSRASADFVTESSSSNETSDTSESSSSSSSSSRSDKHYRRRKRAKRRRRRKVRFPGSETGSTESSESSTSVSHSDLESDRLRRIQSADESDLERFRRTRAKRSRRTIRDRDNMKSILIEIDDEQLNDITAAAQDLGFLPGTSIVTTQLPPASYSDFDGPLFFPTVPCSLLEYAENRYEGEKDNSLVVAQPSSGHFQVAKTNLNVVRLVSGEVQEASPGESQVLDTGTNQASSTASHVTNSPASSFVTDAPCNDRQPSEVGVSENNTYQIYFNSECLFEVDAKRQDVYDSTAKDPKQKLKDEILKIVMKKDGQFYNNATIAKYYDNSDCIRLGRDYEKRMDSEGVLAFHTNMLESKVKKNLQAANHSDRESVNEEDEISYLKKVIQEEFKDAIMKLFPEAKSKMAMVGTAHSKEYDTNTSQEADTGTNQTSSTAPFVGDDRVSSTATNVGVSEASQVATDGTENGIVSAQSVKGLITDDNATSSKSLSPLHEDTGRKITEGNQIDISTENFESDPTNLLEKSTGADGEVSADATNHNEAIEPLANEATVEVSRLNTISNKGWLPNTWKRVEASLKQGSSEGYDFDASKWKVVAAPPKPYEPFAITFRVAWEDLVPLSESTTSAGTEAHDISLEYHSDFGGIHESETSAIPEESTVSRDGTNSKIQEALPPQTTALQRAITSLWSVVSPRLPPIIKDSFPQGLHALNNVLCNKRFLRKFAFWQKILRDAGQNHLMYESGIARDYPGYNRLDPHDHESRFGSLDGSGENEDRRGKSTDDVDAEHGAEEDALSNSKKLLVLQDLIRNRVNSHLKNFTPCTVLGFRSIVTFADNGMLEVRLSGHIYREATVIITAPAPQSIPGAFALPSVDNETASSLSTSAVFVATPAYLGEHFTHEYLNSASHENKLMTVVDKRVSTPAEDLKLDDKKTDNVQGEADGASSTALVSSTNVRSTDPTAFQVVKPVVQFENPESASDTCLTYLQKFISDQKTDPKIGLCGMQLVRHYKIQIEDNIIAAWESVFITPLSFVPGKTILSYLGSISLSIVRETPLYDFYEQKNGPITVSRGRRKKAIRDSELPDILHQFTMESVQDIKLMAQSQAVALGGNGLLRCNPVVLQNTITIGSRSLYCFVSLIADVVHMK